MVMFWLSVVDFNQVGACLRFAHHLGWEVDNARFRLACECVCSTHIAGYFDVNSTELR